MTMAEPHASSRKLMAWILAGLVIWGGLHAISVYFFNFNVWRSVVVLACFAGFIGFWLAAIAARERGISRRS